MIDETVEIPDCRKRSSVATETRGVEPATLSGLGGRGMGILMAGRGPGGIGNGCEKEGTGRLMFNGLGAGGTSDMLLSE